MAGHLVHQRAPVPEQLRPVAVPHVGMQGVEHQQRRPQAGVLDLGGGHRLPDAAAAQSVEHDAEQGPVQHVHAQPDREPVPLRGQHPPHQAWLAVG
jgi:hypothetical protein